MTFCFLFKEKHFLKILKFACSLHKSYVNKPLFVQAGTKSRRTSPIKTNYVKKKCLINNTIFILINDTKASLERLTLKSFLSFNVWRDLGEYRLGVTDH